MQKSKFYQPVFSGPTPLKDVPKMKTTVGVRPEFHAKRQDSPFTRNVIQTPRDVPYQSVQAATKTTVKVGI